MKLDSKKYFKIVSISNLAFIAAFGVSSLSIFTEIFSSDIMVGIVLFTPPIFLLFNMWGVIHAVRKKPMDKYLRMGFSVSIIIIVLIIADILYIKYILSLGAPL